MWGKVVVVVSLFVLASCGSDDSPSQNSDPCLSQNPPASCPDENNENEDMGECAPTAEVCDGEDNDCDGEIDEDFVLGDPCEEGVGVCANTGETVCTEDGSGTVCSAQAGDPSAEEVCDGIDNNCNGDVDEGFDDLGTACSNGVGACAADGVLVCNSAGDGVECDATPGPSEVEVCDGLDNDCDGEVDNGFPTLGDVCTAGVGQCESSGVEVCSADGMSTTCDATPGAPSAEICDGLDNNCDGTPDETFTMKGMSCTNGLGACEAAGTFVCSANGQDVMCDATPGQPSAEVCDGVDNDCNGVEDDGASDANTYYVDCDADGFSASTGGSRQACSSPPDSVAQTACGGTATGTWTTTLPSTIANTDCEDTLEDVFPGQTDFFETGYTLTGGGTSFDYNCNGTPDKYDPEIPSGGCSNTSPVITINGAICRASTPGSPDTGWFDTIPACGTGGIYQDCVYTLTTDISGSPICEGTRQSGFATMSCR